MLLGAFLVGIGVGVIIMYAVYRPLRATVRLLSHRCRVEQQRSVHLASRLAAIEAQARMAKVERWIQALEQDVDAP